MQQLAVSQELADEVVDKLKDARTSDDVMPLADKLLESLVTLVKMPTVTASHAQTHSCDTHSFVHTRTCIRTRACRHALAHADAHARAHARTHAHMHACTHANKHACTYAHTQARMRTRMHARAPARRRIVAKIVCDVHVEVLNDYASRIDRQSRHGHVRRLSACVCAQNKENDTRKKRTHYLAVIRDGDDK